ncbi:MAG: dihydroorotase [Bacteroidales bacterium]|nr:dihydroorotase [Bacteroidales bacterium]MBR0222796.1 dihydroorotase [Bacteroidales bacterium]
MNDTYIIQGGTLVTEAGRKQADILVREGRIAAIDAGLKREGIPVLQAEGLLVVPGLVDVHVHFREPGFSEKETIRTGSLAAARGGYTAVCAMPNLNPVPDSPETLSIEQSIIGRDAVIDVFPYAAITRGRAGLEPVDMALLKGRCIAFSDDGSGVQVPAVMRSAMEQACREECLVVAHCEDLSQPTAAEMEWRQIERDLELAAETGCRYHVCHISTRRSVELIRAAKRSGVRVTCETAPHYLTLCEDDIEDDGRFKMNPPIHTADDRDALIEGLTDGTVDVIATDHAPHTAEEKSRGFAGSLNGIVGLETAFPVLYTHLVATGRLSLERLIEAMSIAPRRIFRIGGGVAVGEEADLALIDTRREYLIDSAEFLSKGRSTPFEGWKVRGYVLLTLKNGKTVWKSPLIP